MASPSKNALAATLIAEKVDGIYFCLPIGCRKLLDNAEGAASQRRVV
jgi:hypothetical protein